jgi:hypothetical protein
VKITWDDLTINSNTINFDDLLSTWRWLVGKQLQPVVVSAIGDLFLRHEDGRIFWLDVACGILSEVAPSAEEFKKLMVQPVHTNEWFIPQLIGDLKASGLNLGPSQCYSYKVPPPLGGEIELSNFEVCDISVHFNVLGQINEQIKDLPEGTSISEISIE